MDEANKQPDDFKSKTDDFFDNFQKIKNFQTTIKWLFGITYLLLIIIIVVLFFIIPGGVNSNHSVENPLDSSVVRNGDSLTSGEITLFSENSGSFFFYNISSSRITGKFSKIEALEFICDSISFFEKGETAMLKLKNGNIMGEKGKMPNFKTLKDIWERMRQESNYSVQLSINSGNKKLITRDAFSDEMQIIKEVESFITGSNFVPMEMSFDGVGTPIKIGENTMRLLKTFIGE